MREFARLVAHQVAGDLRGLPSALRRAPTRSARVCKALNVEELRRRARRSVPRAIFDFVDGGANDELAMARNRRDFEALELHARCLVDVSSLDTRTYVLGSEIRLPLIGGPTGLAGLVHHGGEAALARAVQRAGSIYVLSASASYTIEEVAAAAPGPKWFQLYLWRDRGFVLEMLERAQRAAYSALVVTVDAPPVGRRERDIANGFSVPPRLTTRSLLGGLAHPRWSAGFVAHSRFAMAHAPAEASGTTPLGHVEYMARQFDASVAWPDLDWVRERWRGPLVVKGIVRPEDAAMAIEAGADAIVVSNHGGRQLDDAPSSISVLPRVVDAAEGRAEVYLDSGVRRGSDVVKALALGARACMIARPLLYGLAVAGEQGAAHAMELVAREYELALALSGCTSSAEVRTASLLDGGPAVDSITRGA
jgi:L-lactate dehydrogenase (cytochrome)